MFISFRSSQGLISAQFDEEFLPLLSETGWYAHNYSGNFYIRRNRGQETQLAHRLVMGLVKGDKTLVDHINRDSLDNRRENLRFCSNQQNLWNRRMKNNSTGYMGVSAHRDGRFIGKVRSNKKYFYCGLHSTAELAAKAVNHKLLELRGEFAALNTIRETEKCN
ncbi:MAG: HNH endonuclease [Cellvibrionaceae bacterium]